MEGTICRCCPIRTERNIRPMSCVNPIQTINFRDGKPDYESGQEETYAGGNHKYPSLSAENY